MGSVAPPRASDWAERCMMLDQVTASYTSIAEMEGAGLRQRMIRAKPIAGVAPAHVVGGGPGGRLDQAVGGLRSGGADPLRYRAELVCQVGVAGVVARDLASPGQLAFGSEQ